MIQCAKKYLTESFLTITAACQLHWHSGIGSTGAAGAGAPPQKMYYVISRVYNTRERIELSYTILKMSP